MGNENRVSRSWDTALAFCRLGCIFWFIASFAGSHEHTCDIRLREIFGAGMNRFVEFFY
jgi:hypothetical protein